jgi:hypothetical protein
MGIMAAGPAPAFGSQSALVANDVLNDLMQEDWDSIDKAVKRKSNAPIGDFGNPQDPKIIKAGLCLLGLERIGFRTQTTTDYAGLNRASTGALPNTSLGPFLKNII